MGIIHFDASKITHLARVIISGRKGKTTPNDCARDLSDPLPFLEGVILPHLKNLKLPPENV